MNSYNFTMPYPPSVNVWKSPFKNRLILTARGREYRNEAIKRLNELGLANEGIDKKVKVNLILNPPSNRRYDIDNFCKSLFDAMSKSGFWLDDEQIYELSIKKGTKTSGGNVEVSVTIIEE